MYQSAKLDRDWKIKPAAPRAGFLSVLSGMRSALIKVGVLTAIGAAVPLFFTDAVPQKFSAEIRLKLGSVSETAVNNATTALRSKASLDNLVRALNLGTGSEFAVDRPSAVRVVSDIVSGQEMTMAQAESKLRDRLSKAIAVTYDRAKGQAVISVVAAQADEAARIANLLGETFRNELSFSGSATSQPVVEKLRQTLDHAEAALSGFMSQTDEQKLAELRRTENEAQQRGAEMTEAQAQLADLKQKVAEAASLKLADVLSKPLPDALEYTGLDYQRQRHVETKLLVDQLSGNFGPRHPKLLVAQAALDDVRNDIQDALKQLVASLRQQEAAATRRLAELKAKQTAKPDDKEIADSAAQLRALESAVGEARENYLEALHRSEAESKAPVTKVDIVAAATAAGARQLGPSPVETSGGGALVGFCLGLTFAFFMRAKPEHQSDDFEPAMQQPDALDSDWQDDFPEQAQCFDNGHDPIYGEPDYDEENGDYLPRPVHTRYPAPANDTPLGDQIRDMLMANRRPAGADAGLPPLVAAVMSGRVSQAPVHTAAPRMSEEELRKAEEVRELRRHMTELRERVEVYSASRNTGRR